MTSAHVPKFGNWEDKDVPYTKYFENARKDRVGGFNPNDPEENPEAFMPSKMIPGQISKKEPRKSSSSSQRSSNADSGRKSIKNTESHSDKSSSTAIPASGSHHSAASNHRSTASPVHGSPTSSHVSSDASVHGKPASLPKFGSWKEAEQTPDGGYTVIFNGVKEKKQNAATSLPPVPANATAYQQQKEIQRSLSKNMCCFFPRTQE
ncbi:RPM1-interacting protein 4 [Apostasia shenzhenica]|uniref:RPM1-interacting protein 4 n=1 Tax=Apostasia shenzhenica TaxID=1088818 RepID=A0A2I0AM13_9ASPA|nr:RPM1-interacting protein 4 [Apostasia shenzhenica]